MQLRVSQTALHLLKCCCQCAEGHSCLVRGRGEHMGCLSGGWHTLMDASLTSHRCLPMAEGGMPSGTYCVPVTVLVVLATCSQTLEKRPLESGH